MTDLEFEQLATINPFDESEDFLAAVAKNPARQKLVEELKGFETDLLGSLESVIAPENLKQRLLDIPETNIPTETTAEAANDSIFWTRRVLPVAACLILVAGIVLNYIPGQSNSFEAEIFEHIYHDSAVFDVDDQLSIVTVNQQMQSTLGNEFSEDPELDELDVSVAKECWVAKANSIHMVVQGEFGPMTVMVIPNTPIDVAMHISDEQMQGLITPMATGNLVVVGEMEEDVSMYSNLLASNMNW